MTTDKAPKEVPISYTDNKPNLVAGFQRTSWILGELTDKLEHGWVVVTEDGAPLVHASTHMPKEHFTLMGLPKKA